VHLEDGGTVVGDELLVAAGRTPATAHLGLEVVGLEPGRFVPSTTSCASRGTSGSTPPATSTAGCC
jgi:dihydrolipoamide dehydrogenase